MTEHREHPSYGMCGIKEPWEPLSEEMKKGLELAAFICRMYGQGEPFAEAILSVGEQTRGRWWMEYESREAEAEKEMAEHSAKLAPKPAPASSKPKKAAK